MFRYGSTVDLGVVLEPEASGGVIWVWISVTEPTSGRSVWKFHAPAYS
jgi:hypothetical protein